MLGLCAKLIVTGNDSSINDNVDQWGPLVYCKLEKNNKKNQITQIILLSNNSNLAIETDHTRIDVAASGYDPASIPLFPDASLPAMMGTFLDFLVFAVPKFPRY